MQLVAHGTGKITQCLALCLAFTVSHHEPEAQTQDSAHVLFQNEDFAIVRVRDLWERNPQNSSVSGLLISRKDEGAANHGDELLKLEWSHKSPANYYWADSAKAESISANARGILILSKSDQQISPGIFKTEAHSPFSDSVGDDIEAMSLLLDRARYDNVPSPKDQMRARIGFEDLAFKSKWISSVGPNVSLTNPLIEVTARTFSRSGREIQHCSIWYVPLAWEDDHNHWKRFSRYSSPSTESIPVGQFKMWANHNGQNGSRILINPGDDQKLTKKIDLDVP